MRVATALDARHFGFRHREFGRIDVGTPLGAAEGVAFRHYAGGSGLADRVRGIIRRRVIMNILLAVLEGLMLPTTALICYGHFKRRRKLTAEQKKKEDEEVAEFTRIW
jgi:hypothetical protein